MTSLIAQGPEAVTAELTRIDTELAVAKKKADDARAVVVADLHNHIAAHSAEVDTAKELLERAVNPQPVAAPPAAAPAVPAHVAPPLTLTATAADHAGAATVLHQMLEPVTVTPLRPSPHTSLSPATPSGVPGMLRSQAFIRWAVAAAIVAAAACALYLLHRAGAL